MKNKRFLALGLAVCSLLSLAAGCTSRTEPSVSMAKETVVSERAAASSASAAQEDASPKYVFLFIGDGMSYPQFQAASDYLGALAEAGENDGILSGGVPLSFMEFPVAGSATTYDSSSFDPDSASTATSIATGRKTYSGVINMDESKTESFVTIAEQLKAQKGYEIGVISTVNLNHATPAAFYAHQPSRNNYYEIGLELIASNFDYFAGGGLKKVNGSDGEQASLYALAEEAGYTVAMTSSEAEAISAGTEKAILIDENLADSDAMAYEIDRAEGQWGLAEYVEKGIEVLDNENGFFMMVEGGKIDWACHANDAGSTIADVLALDAAVKVALSFAEEHPEETLILVTGDHETGGLTIGFAGTDYDTYLDNIAQQKISFIQYDEQYISKYIAEQTPFEEAMADVEALFGLVTPENGERAASESLVLNDYEMGLLETAYGLTVNDGFAKDENGSTLYTQEQYVDYGGYTAFSVTVTHLLNNKSGLNFASYAHTGTPVAVFAKGAGQESFTGYYDNTDIYFKMAELLDIA